MKNVLIDQNCKWLAKDENREVIKDFDEVYVVGVDMKQSSFDENCADFCVKNTCDFLLSRKTTHSVMLNLQKSVTNVIKNKLYDWKVARVSVDGQIQYE